MSYVHIKEFVEACIRPTKSLLKDPDPYVRKTAAFCVAKLYDHDRALVERTDLIDRLNAMLRDDNPTVVASALAALMDIWERSDAIKLTIDYGNASKMVQILPDCSEWVMQTRRYDIVANIIQVGPNLYSRSSNVLCPSRLIGSSLACRENSPASFPLQFCCRTDLYPSRAVFDELYRRPEADFCPVQKTFSSIGYATG